MNFVELLEDRIAPAAIATFTDTDGDQVMVSSSKGTSAALQTLVDASVSMGQMQTLSLTGEFAGTALKIKVSERGTTTDGLVHVWAINAGGMDLASVEVGGDLSKLLVGDSNYANGSVKMVKVQSIGEFGGASDKTWQLSGGTSTFEVGGNIVGASILWNNPANAGGIKVGKLSIGGSLQGESAMGTGVIQVLGGAPDGVKKGVAEIGTLIVGGNLSSSAFDQTGAIIVGNTNNPTDYPGKIGSVTIGGSLEGASGKAYTGAVFATTSIGNVSIGGELNGGGNSSGSVIASTDSIGAVKIYGIVTGGDGGNSGSVVAGKNIKSVFVGGALIGGSGTQSGSVIAEFGKMDSVSVGAHVLGSSGQSSGAIFALGGIGKVNIGGGVEGGSGDYSGVIRGSTLTGIQGAKTGSISIQGDLTGGSGSHSGAIEMNSVGTISIAGSLVGGTVQSYTGVVKVNQLGSISIGQHVISDASGSSQSAGIWVEDTAAKVGSIVIGGNLVGGDDAAAANTGIIDVAGSLKTLKIGGNVEGNLSGSSARIEVDGKADFVQIGGSIIGGGSSKDANGNNSAKLILNGGSDSVKIGGSVVGGLGLESGYVELHGNISSIDLGGGIVGGGGLASGTVEVENAGSLKVGVAPNTTNSVLGGSGGGGYLNLFGTSKTAFIAGDIVGGSTAFSGNVSLGNIGDFTLGGNLIGGTNSSTGRIDALSVGTFTVQGNVSGSNNASGSGYIFVQNSVKKMDIFGDLEGGNDTMAASTIFNSGAVLVGGNLDSITVGGSIVGGSSVETSSFNLGAIRAGIIGSMVVKGDIVGTSTSNVLVTGQGNTNLNSGENPAIKSLTVYGSVSHANILGGYDLIGTTLNGDGGTNGGGAQLGSVTILGNFKDSSIATGLSNGNASPNHWADGSNTFLSSNPIVASIAKITIKGVVSATTQNGIAAERILALNIGGFAIPVAPGTLHEKVVGNNFWIEQVT